MRVLFRCDSSTEIGTGHVYRCISLAQELRARNHQVDFLMLPLVGNVSSRVEELGFSNLSELSAFDQQYEWVVVDHYGMDEHSEHQFRSISKKILVIDDFGRRKHDADLIIDPSLSESSGSRRSANPNSLFRSGPEWSLLRQEFREARDLIQKSTEIQNVLFFFGGTDPANLVLPYFQSIEEALEAGLFQNQKIHFLVSHDHASLSEILNMATKSECEVHVSPESVAELMIKMDIYCGTSGTITWERMCLGLTGVVVSIADNQVNIAQTLNDQGLCVYAGDSQEKSPKKVLMHLQNLIQDVDQVKVMSQKCYQSVDGLGVLRVVNEMERMLHE